MADSPNQKQSSERQARKGIVVKMLAYHLAFLVLHYSYDWFPNPVTKLFSGTSEAMFEHMKIAFYAYLLVKTALV